MRYLPLVLFVLTVLSCSTPPKDCSKFKTGTFEYTNLDYSDWIVTRNDSTQIEFDKKTNFKLVGDIKWLSNCQYTLTYKEVSDSSKSNLIGVTVTVDILSTSENSYKYHAYDEKQENKGKMIKLE